MKNKEKSSAGTDKNLASAKESQIPKIKKVTEKKKRDPIYFKGIEIGYTGDLMDDENVPF